MDIEAEFKEAEEFVHTLPGLLACQRVGSATYLPDIAADVDLCVLVADKGGDHSVDDYVMENLTPQGWSPCGEYDHDPNHPGVEWIAVRRGNANLMITCSREFYNGYEMATKLCRALRLMNKEDRIIVCRIVRDGRTVEEVNEMRKTKNWDAPPPVTVTVS